MIVKRMQLRSELALDKSEQLGRKGCLGPNYLQQLIHRVEGRRA